MVTKISKPDTSTSDNDGVESLKALQAEAHKLETAPQVKAEQAEQQQVEQATENTATELLTVLTIVRTMAVNVMQPHHSEKFQTIWTDAVLKNASDAGAQVMELHGLTMGGVMGKYAPYIALAAAVAPPTIATVQLLKIQPPEPPEPQKEQNG